MLNIIFPAKSPVIAGIQFDAVLEDKIEASIELTRYPIESGVQVNDHRILNPTRYYITGAIGSQPIKPLISSEVDWSDLYGVAIGAASNLLRNNPYVGLVAGLSGAFLAGSVQSRAAAMLDQLVNLMQVGLPFDVDAVDRQLKDMVITNISRTRDPENEGGLIVTLEIQELITLKRIAEASNANPTADQLPDGDPIQAAATVLKNRGQQMNLKNPADVVIGKVREAIIDAIPL